ncbi:MAG: hypothetical protein MK132_19225 [Lentisphaerales bacterium]|nr:hypothetical protein [Lentisphaerales bacterium]
MRRRGPLRGRFGYTRIILLMYSRLAAIDPYLQATEASPINRDSSSHSCKIAQTQSAASKLLDRCILSLLVEVQSATANIGQKAQTIQN